MGRIKITPRILDYVALFILNATELILELVASRFLSPYFGNSNFVWTAIIGMILLASSLGNLIGGRLTRLKNVRLIAGMALLGAAIYLAITPAIGRGVLEEISNLGQSVQFLSVLASIIFFLIPATTLGIITPIIMKDQINEKSDHGKESGRITAIIAIGSLVGTFAGGFWLIPAMGTNAIFILLAIMIVPCSLLIRPIRKPIDSKNLGLFISGLAITLIIIIISLVAMSSVKTGKSISIDTEYGQIQIGEDEFGTLRTYKQNATFESATFLSQNNKYDLVYEYLKKYDEMFNFLDIKSVAMIGGAAYQYPKYYISHFPDKSMDVIEIDPQSTEIAKEYFFLDDLINEYHTNDNNRLGLYNEDGRVFLNNSSKTYDAVLNDAFSGEVPPANLTTIEAAQVIKNRLASDGVYFSNVLGSVNGKMGKFLRAEYLTLKEVFKHVYVIAVYPGISLEEYTNWMMVATDNDSYQPQNVITVELSKEDILLTDDYCPIDSLISTDFLDRYLSS